MISHLCCLGFFLALFLGSISSDIDDYLPLTTGHTSTNYGETGLFEMPTARFQEAGNLKFGFLFLRRRISSAPSLSPDFSPAIINMVFLFIFTQQ